jgi:hypothetical protein
VLDNAGISWIILDTQQADMSPEDRETKTQGAEVQRLAFQGAGVSLMLSMIRAPFGTFC